jgi:hypothetical protein
VFTVTVTAYSDGYLDVGPMTRLDSRRAENLVDVLLDMEIDDRERKRAASTAADPAKPVSYPVGDRCHAATKSGKRCSRGAKSTTGFCWQHQGADPAF